MTQMRSRRNWLVLAVVALSLSLGLWACSGDNPETATGPSLMKTDQLGLTVTNPEVQRVMKIQDRATPSLFEDPLVVGTATGMSAGGEVIIKVYTEDFIPPGKLPDRIEGVKVEQMVTGRVVAKKGGPPPMDGGSSGADPQAPQSAPVKMGTSGGWRYDLANGYCCGGTLGSLIQDGQGTQYVLSNWHVLYSDIVSGGNSRVASAGDPVIQPGLIDVGCNANNSLNVATLLAPNTGGSLPGANVDAGVAQVIPGQVDASGAILDIGTISSSTVGASIGQAVKKMGRTTGLGRATVDGLNANIQIGYENECAGGSAFTKTYTGQIVTTNNRCNFLDGGDSGSLMVEDVDTNPRAVGLLYAGSVTCNKQAIAIANPINDVLSFYSSKLPGTVTMVGN